MRLLEFYWTVKPPEHRRPLYHRCLRRQNRPIRGMGPAPKVVDQAMLLGIAMDVGHQSGKVAIVVDQSSPDIQEPVTFEALDPDLVRLYWEAVCVEFVTPRPRLRVSIQRLRRRKLAHNPISPKHCRIYAKGRTGRGAG